MIFFVSVTKYANFILWDMVLMRMLMEFIATYLKLFGRFTYVIQHKLFYKSRKKTCVMNI